MPLSHLHRTTRAFRPHLDIANGRAAAVIAVKTIRGAVGGIAGRERSLYLSPSRILIWKKGAMQRHVKKCGRGSRLLSSSAPMCGGTTRK
jgi:hypothetical protein